MNIPAVGGVSGYTSLQKLQTEKENETKKTEETGIKTDKKDVFVKTETTPPVTYEKPNKLNAQQVDMLKADAEQRAKSMQDMIRSMITKQGQKSNLKMFGMNLTVTPAQSAAAAASIAEGGEYSVEKVASNIMNMAKALSGGDPSKISELRRAVEKGFSAAGRELGGLPDISNRTHDEVMRQFDEWENGVE